MIKEKVAFGIEFLTLVFAIFIFVLAILFLTNKFFKKIKIYQDILDFLNENYLFFGFIVALAATLGSLFYSDVMGYNPCILCWYQRIFMYSQPVLFLIAMKNKNKAIIKNSITFSIIGALIAAYHYLTQINVLKGACEVVGYSSSCSEFFTLSYGFITIPMMALIAFLIIIILGISKSFEK